MPKHEYGLVTVHARYLLRAGLAHAHRIGTILTTFYHIHHYIYNLPSPPHRIPTALFNTCRTHTNLEKAMVSFQKRWDYSYKITLTIPVASASAERSFSVLKQVRTYLRSIMGQQGLNNLAILAIEHDLSKSLDYDSVVDNFMHQNQCHITLK